MTESSLDFSPAEHRVIGMMVKAGKTLPDDFWAVAIVQELARLVVQIEPLLSDEQAALLVGVGGYISHHGKAEMMAQLQTAMVLAKVAPGNRPPSTP